VRRVRHGWSLGGGDGGFRMDTSFMRRNLLHTTEAPTTPNPAHNSKLGYPRHVQYPS
jgi:hypothetical protein